MVGEVIVERYELEELVGTGGMSSVFRARDRLQVVKMGPTMVAPEPEPAPAAAEKKA